MCQFSYLVGHRKDNSDKDGNRFLTVVQWLGSGCSSVICSMCLSLNYCDTQNITDWNRACGHGVLVV